MSSGLNPAGILCLGAINTSIVLIGNAIKIDNTTSEITINGIKVPDASGTQLNFDSVINSKAGLNPSGTLHIGVSTAQIIMGLLKIDNTVIPSQVYINGVAYPPIEIPVAHDYTLAEDSTGDKDTLSDQISFVNVDGNDDVRVIGKLVTLPPSPWGTNVPGEPPPEPETVTRYTMLELVDGGTYEFNMDLNVVDAGSDGPFAPPAYLYLVVSSSSDPIVESYVLLDFSAETSHYYNKKFNFNAAAGTRVYFDTNVTKMFTSTVNPLGGLTINKIGTKISIKRIGAL